MAVTPGKDLTPRKEAPPKTRMKTDVKEAHGARRIMKDTEGARAQEERRAAVRALHNILRGSAFRLGREWTEPRAARRARRRLDDARLKLQFIITEDAGYHYVDVTDAASAAPATRRRRTKQT